MPRPALALIAVCAAAFAPQFSIAQSPDSACKIEGQVLSAATGAPLKNATLKLTMRGLVQPPGHSVNDGTFETTSGSEGRFLFDAIPPAKYRLSVERTGYVVGGYDGILECLTPAESNTRESKNIVLKLTPQAIISGRVVDDDGEPVPAAEVEVLRRSWVNGSRRLNKIALEETHADGSFAIGGLTAGRYYLRASHRKEEDDPAEPGRKGSVKEAFVPTFFPAALDVTGATPIDVAAGAQIPGIDIRLKKSRAFRVSGKVVTSASKSLLDDIELDLFQQDGPPATPSAEIGDGRFEFREIIPGSYIIRPDSGSHSLTLVGSIAIAVRDEDVRDLSLVLGAPVEVKGTWALDGADIGDVSPPYLIFTPDNGQAQPQMWVANGGKFTAQLGSGRHRLEVMHPGYVKSIRLNGQDAAADKIDLNGPSTLDLVISMKGGEINPVVRNAEGGPVTGSRIQICDSRDFCTPRFFQQFAPGDYRVCAWADDGDGIITVPEFRAAFESQCAKVTLAEKSHETVELNLITKEAMAIEAAKIP
jgi:hypothetical protein